MQVKQRLLYLHVISASLFGVPGFPGEALMLISAIFKWFYFTVLVTYHCSFFIFLS